jgi:hypothetical protein
MKQPFALAGEHPSTDTVAVLVELLDLARSGQLIGVAYVGMFKRRHLQTGTTGEASRSPVFTVGAVRVLEESIIHHIVNSR